MQAIQIVGQTGQVKNELMIPAAIINSGVKLGEEYTLDIFQQGKRELKLNRTQYQIVSSNDFKIDFQKCIFYLPTFNHEKFHCKISLVNYELNESDGRFVIESLNGNPFRHNGSWSFHAYIEKNDLIQIGFNSFHFRSHKNNQEENIVPDLLAKSKLAVLIEGETGTGKTRLAKIIHENSGVNGNFIHLNLSAYSNNLIESELFGHIKGAFTGASNDKKGAILDAHKGTLFLDEIDSLSLEIQTKLLIFLESYEFRPVGSERVIKSDARIIIASGKNLSILVSENKIRKDFFFRLNSGHNIKLQNLREEPNKIIEFCNFFEQSEYVVMSEELKQFYLKYQWPGNIRQLKNHLIKKKVLANGKKIVLDENDQSLCEDVNCTEVDFGKILPLAHVKYSYCLKALSKTNQSIIGASKILEISQNTLRSILKRGQLRGH